MNSVHSFPKSEKLCRRKAIENLFASGNRSLTAFPLRVVYGVKELPKDETPIGCEVLMSVSKRHFKHAVDRNRAKRQMREAWRLHRGILCGAREDGEGQESRPLLLAFIWLSDRPLPSDLIHRKMKNLLHRIAEETAATTAGLPEESE